MEMTHVSLPGRNLIGVFSQRDLRFFLMQYLNLVWARYTIIMQKSNIHWNVCE